MGLPLLFTLISLWYTWISLRTLVQFWRERRTLFDDNVTPLDRANLDRGAFFLLVPLGVLLHEVGHAAATWQVGGSVATFRWLIFWGYVIPEGSFTPLEDWWISIAGNLVGVALAFAALSAITLARGRAWRYWGLSFGRLQLFYALLFYPAFSMVTGFGDWVQIYGPLMSEVSAATSAPEVRPWALLTLGTHVLLLGLWLVAERSTSLRERVLARFAPPRLAELQRRAVQQGDAETMTRLAVEYASAGETRLAESAFRDAMDAHPEHPVPAINAASFEARRGRHDRALKLYAQSMERGADDRLRAIALEGMAVAELASGRARKALPHLDRALALRQDDAGLHLLRAQVRWRLDDPEGARHDLRAAEEGGEERVLREVAALREEMELA